MTRLRILIICLLCTTGTVYGQGRPDRGPPSASGDIVPGLLEIMLRPEALERFDRSRVARGELTTGLPSLDVLNRQERVQAIRLPALDHRERLLRPRSMCLLKFPPEADMERLARQYARLPDIEFAEPVRIYHTLLAPDDTHFSNQWAHSPDHLRSVDAWEQYTAGNEAVVIALIDTGMDWEHPDLKPNLWINSGEDINNNGRFDNFAFPEGDLNGVDDDGNGYIDDVIGWDFFERNPDPQQGSDEHGTMMAGVAVAATNNALGMAGVAGGWHPNQPGCRIMVLRAGDGNALYSFLIWQAIDYARMNGAHVINMSFAGGYSAAVARAVRDAWNAGLVMAAAAGATDSNAIRYPAAYPEILSVGGTRQDDTKQDRSPWGMTVDVSAPGHNILTTVRGGGYATIPAITPSLAVAHVSGLAGLVWSYLGVDTPADQVYATLKYSTDYITGATSSFADHSGFVGTGRINSYNALKMAANTLVVPDLYPTIAAALDAASAGQTVYVRPGTYSGNISMKSGVRLIGARSDLTNIEGPVLFSGVSDAELAGVTVSGMFGIYLSNSPRVLVRNCRIASSIWGLLVYSSAPTLRHNEIIGNNTGIYLGPNAGTGAVVENNRIEGNSKGLYARSTPTLYNRRNSIKNSSVYHLEATSESGIIVALRNWWGEDPPDRTRLMPLNRIYYYPNLTYDPIPSTHTPPKRGVPTPAPSALASALEEEQAVIYVQGRERLEAGQFETAMELFRQLVEEYPDGQLARVALKEIVGAYHQHGRANAARTYLEDLTAQNPSLHMRQAARRMQFDLLLLEERYVPALALARTLQRDIACSETVEELIFQTARIQYFALNRRQEGEAAFEAYLEQYPDNGEDLRQVRRSLAYAFLGEQPPPKEEVSTDRRTTPSQRALLEIRGPNPFNPQTEIAVQLTAPTLVDLRVYNAMGQMVRTLAASQQMQAGHQRVVWDGTDDHGRTLASGLYLVRLTADRQTTTRKLTLLR